MKYKQFVIYKYICQKYKNFPNNKMETLINIEFNQSLSNTILFCNIKLDTKI